MDYAAELKNMSKNNDFIICFDSDGCVFDTMEIKHKECFCPAFIKHMNLQAGSKYAREVWEFVNLYSKTRGCNRFLAVKHALAFLRDRDEMMARNIDIPTLDSLMSWLEVESKLGNPDLEAKVKETADLELTKTLEWSKEVNSRIEDIVYGISPFPGVMEVLRKADGKADIMVVSQTPLEALKREWEEHKMAGYVSVIAGQEHGTKVEHIKFAAEGKGYDASNILMVGDAPGDLKAAEANNALFMPIVPGHEEVSWAEFATEGLERFFNGTFAGEYQEKLLNEFDKALPESPEWG
jgi:phosphoglycolate phosphatase-like HAD superfamily hydrolase